MNYETTKNQILVIFIFLVASASFIIMERKTQANLMQDPMKVFSLNALHQEKLIKSSTRILLLLKNPSMLCLKNPQLNLKIQMKKMMSQKPPTGIYNKMNNIKMLKIMKTTKNQRRQNQLILVFQWIESMLIVTLRIK